MVIQTDGTELKMYNLFKHLESMQSTTSSTGNESTNRIQLEGTYSF